MPRYEHRPFDCRPAPELSGAAPGRYSVVIVGAGPVGLALAIDLALHGVTSVVLDDNNVVSVGSRAICWAKRTLEIFDRLGVGATMAKKGVTWQVGRLYHRDEEIWSFDLLPEPGHRMPAFVNLQQYHVEAMLVERAQQFPELIDLRFKSKVTAVDQLKDGARVTVETPDGGYPMETDWLVACDGARSFVRGALGLEFSGQTFEEKFLICDIEMEDSPFGAGPAERRFWFEPSFHDGQSVLLHKQPDNIYRIDLQLGRDADVEFEKREENVLPRIRRIVGDRPFSIDWMSIYRFTCARLERFVRGRVIFCGDSAHVVSPFGARGGNGGIQDADNLGWKLAAVIKGEAPAGPIESYNDERVHASDENIGHSTRATNFMTPKSPVETMFRDEVLHLARDHAFARKLINSGRLSLPCALAGSSLVTPNPDAPLQPGSAAPDAPIRSADGEGWLLHRLGGEFMVLSVGPAPDLADCGVPHLVVAPGSGFEDPTGLVATRYGTGWTYLVRPDQHVAAAFDRPDAATVRVALSRARGQSAEERVA
ncbi:3-(3-hydroxy-phenyl)propionate hydroxylase [Hoeflea marina]|uniref:3-(3-hydroxy-phenyl)propionate hydroxylase n=1 Tax=Hoeflea marina TaxID=274592 RepID=A0A317PRS6_9HYPH|nr:FAD-dependent oxidoreductase [Hoeflea marina]PWW04168.1 3-(3-hydroxy-phenyl)propionate hydroxylase [Hoeflea marina]